MADEERLKSSSSEEEIKTAVLSVLKKDTILKRIFLNVSPPPSPPPTTGGDAVRPSRGGREDDDGQVVLFGRHPDCHVVVDHPSISRFHVAARLVPLRRKLSVTDLSSVHGTWVSGTKIQPNVAVDMVDGDTLSLGASTRVYRLEWVSSSRALEMENLLETLAEGKEETNQDDSGDLTSNTKDPLAAVIPSAPPLLESINLSSLPVEQEQHSPLPEAENSCFSSPVPMLECDAPLMPTTVENSSTKVSSATKQPSERREHLSPERSEARSMPSSLLSLRSKSMSVGFLRTLTARRTERLGEARADTDVQEGTGKDNYTACEQAKSEGRLCRVLFDNLCENEQDREECFASDKENETPMSGCQKTKRSYRVLQNSACVAEHSDAEANTACSADKENWKHEVLSDLRPRKPTSESSVSSSKGDVTSGSDHKILKSITSAANLKKMSHSSIIRDSSDVSEELLYSDKVNRTPESCKDMKSRRVVGGNLAKARDNDGALPSDKKESSFSSQTRTEEAIAKKRVERIPFQPVLENSASKSKSSACNCASIKDDLSVKCESDCSPRRSMGAVLHKAEARKIWNVVVDADCFLDEESRRSLQLLEGLKGTHLIVPRLVIRELDCLKRRESLFGGSTKLLASKALQWIEGCMVKTNWWIHVQSSAETMTVAPTPPVSPRTLSLPEIDSPSAEDHILDCALSFKKAKRDGQLVLLSNSITLKIKAMAEGLPCETPKEFRESLVNPFSKRFLWPNSSPRGSTWCCSDDVGMFEKCFRHQHHPPVRKVGRAAEAVKGLKLILLHGCHQHAHMSSK
ncbi:unnamed protein product [Musa acuminata subsp. burmannicoides]